MPAVAVVVTGGAIAGSVITVAQAAPDLPPKTPAQLLADIASTHKIPALTGTVVETASLGLPALPQTGNPTSLASLITGSHTIKVYWQDATHFRLALPQTMSETDVVGDGSTAWIWESASNSATKFSLAADGKPKAKAQLPPLTPQQAANDALQAVGKTTVVSVDSAVTVAGQAAYELVLAPKDSRSTIGSIRIAIDGKTGVPLRVQVFAKGAGSPAFQVGYTEISYVAPSPANFAFTPPPGAAVDNTTKPQAAQKATKQPALNGTSGTYGSGWLTVAEVPQSLLSMAGTTPAKSPAVASAGSPWTGAFGADSQAAISAFLGAGKTVSGSWGTGQLIHTSVLNVLIVGNEMYIGAVDASVLYASVGHATPASTPGN
ncbi:MAG: Outer rane lipoproteinsorting protein-like protein [Actinomycetia bacterium]|nr:Outer rane lipoproteinsorting protein-like protein [Actinomycetes bacterium]